MYLYPVSYQPINKYNTLTKQKYNPEFRARFSNKFLGMSMGMIVPQAAFLTDMLTDSAVDKEDISKKSAADFAQSLDTNNSTNNKASAMHHPDFYEILNDGYEILASSYFRHDGFYGSPSNDFVFNINGLKRFFNKTTLEHYKNNKIRMLIGGIGESQEPFSNLAVIKELIGTENLSDYLDLHTVDLQAEPSKESVFKHSYYDNWGEPAFARTSFIADNGRKYGLPEYKRYRVNNEILDYLLKVYDNPEKARWQSRIQDVLKEYPDKSFEIASINNTLIYIKDHDELIDAIKNIYRILTPGGIFITDDRLKEYQEVFTPDNSYKLDHGIYLKI